MKNELKHWMQVVLPELPTTYESSGKTYGDFFYLYRPLIDIVCCIR